MVFFPSIKHKSLYGLEFIERCHTTNFRVPNFFLNFDLAICFTIIITGVRPKDERALVSKSRCR